MTISLGLDQQLTALRPQLLRFARQRVKNEAMAEDVVQESLLAVLEKPERYAGKSTLATYVIGILKFKIIDSFRRASHASFVQEEDFLDSASLDTEPSTEVNKLVGERYGVSLSSLCTESNPLAALEQKNFFATLQSALDQLPPQRARVFALWDGLELESTDICEELGITKNNLMVVLHRARHALRHTPSLQSFAPSSWSAARH